MRILVDLGHPAHVHFYKHAIRRLQEQGHEVVISARDKDVTLALLDHYGFPYRTLSAIGKGSLGLLREFLQREAALLQLIQKFDPDVVTAIGGLFIAPACKLLGKRSMIFTDTESVPLDKFFTYPLASLIYTPDCFMKDLGERHRRYAGYHELAYLHPSHFQPDPNVLKELGISANESFVILRFVAWRATHDIGEYGLPLSMKRKIVETLSHYGRVFITSESPLPEEFEAYRIGVPPHRIHDVLYYARLVMGEGATMASEAALLGTPSVYSSSLALSLGNFIELMDRYQLVYSYKNSDEALQKAVNLLEQDDIKEEWERRRQRLLAEKIDVTEWMINVITQ